MLLEFRLENFKLFSDFTVFSMKKGRKKELDYSIIKKKIGNDEIEILPTKVIYGNNASGKTSLLMAMKVLKDIVLSGKINSNDSNTLLSDLPIFHFIHKKDKFMSPFLLGVTFLFDSHIYNYDLKICNYTLNEDEIDCKVVYEKLDVDNFNIFIRNDNKVKFNKTENIKAEFFMRTLDFELLSKLELIFEENSNDDEIFTSWFNINGFLVSSFRKWFSDKLAVINGLENIKLGFSPVTLEKKENYSWINKNLVKLLKEADFGPQMITFEAHKSDAGTYETSINSVYKIKSESDEESIGVKGDSSKFESLGTMKLIKFLGPFIEAMRKGKTMMVDELDSSLHPEIVAGIINVFNDPDINEYGAQLIFTTHNPMFLNNNLFRRDEIVFVEKDKYNYSSTINTLDDFDIRGDEKFLKNYMEGKYTIFSDIDFGHIIQEIKKEESDNG